MSNPYDLNEFVRRTHTSYRIRQLRNRCARLTRERDEARKERDEAKHWEKAAQQLRDIYGVLGGRCSSMSAFEAVSDLLAENTRQAERITELETLDAEHARQADWWKERFEEARRELKTGVRF